MSRSTTGKVKLDIVKLEKAKNSTMRRRDNLNIQIFKLDRMIEGLKAAVTTAKGV